MSVIIVNSFAFGAPPAAPGTPEFFTMTAISTSQIDFEWGGPADADYFDLDIDTDPGFGSPTSYTTDGADRAHTFDSLSSNTLYYGRMRARNAGGSSSYTDSSATTWS